MYISNVNISQTVTDMATLQIAKQMESHMLPFDWHMACLHLTIAQSKCQGQGNSHFDCEYLANSDI